MSQPADDTVIERIAPKLYDPVRAVRFEAAMKLARVPQEKIRDQDRTILVETLQEYRQAMEYNSDFAPQRFNLGNLEQLQGNSEKAIEFYQAAIDIDEQFFPAKVNLAMVYNTIGKNEEAEHLLRQVVAARPRLYEVAYSLGLLLSEMEKYTEAALYLGRAADGMPYYSRVRYNHGLALLKLQRWQEGAEALKKAVLLEPNQEEYFVTLVKLYLNFRMNGDAIQLARDVLQLAPDHVSAKEFLEVVQKAQ